MQNVTERTFRGEDVKIYSTRTLLADLEGASFSTPTLLTTKPLRVYSADGRHLGHATVFLEGNRILADIQIDYACEERLLAETQSERRWAWMIGKLGFRGGYRSQVSENGSLGIDVFTADPYLQIDEIVISSTPPGAPEVGLFGVEVTP